MRAATLWRGLAALSVVTAGVLRPAAAQRSALREVHNWGLAGGSLALAVPVGEFRDHVGEGGGFDMFMAFNLNRAGATAIRVDGSLLLYGSARDRAFLSGPYYFPIGVTTSSFIASLRAGPQLTFGQGPVKLYGFWQGGFSYFATTTSFGGYDCGCGGYDEITEHGDMNLAWEAGGGFLVPLGHGRHRVMLDLGARYLANGQAQYLPARFVGNGTTLPIESEANLVAIHLGVTFALR
jgi:hypothetical protein